MKQQLVNSLIAGLFGLFALSGIAAELDFGDHSSETLTSKAWEALNAGKQDQALAFADKCIELHGKEAVKMQKKLTDFADDSEASKYWALNDVGTCYFIKGKALEKQGKKKEAAAALTYLKDNLGYSQCWDPNGWFWHPAEAAAELIAELK